ncbi:MAG: phenylalanine--tRNA ligase subunit alpha [Rhizobiales bacterium]|nr:phenylalanine--tRNA ligase subunit alpha [Hyphomicrobiales bacterium]
MSTLEDDKLEALAESLTAEVAAAATLEALEAVRISALGKKGRISDLMKGLGSLSPDERRQVGQALNALKDRVAEAITSRRDALGEAELEARLASERADVSLPVRSGPEALGRIHPISQVWDEITEIFAAMGFSVAEGPDIESEELNFDKLNMPDWHPARQDMDTFYFPAAADGSRKLLRTHTSPVQIRTMQAQEPPVRIIAPGRVYRSDSDQTHTPMFHQIEGLVIDEETHMGHLKWCLEEFCKAFFEVDEVKMRFRASHFPFTEPSMEVDIDKAAVGKPGEWLEILGCGMVHPNVLRAVGYDPARYQGFAFGMGIDRIAMLKYGIPDLRDMFSADLRWLRHFGLLGHDVPTLAGGLSR